jgi:hypothetical protein
MSDFKDEKAAAEKTAGGGPPATARLQRACEDFGKKKDNF